MTSVQVRKNKVVLADYNFKRDIENRLLMAHLSELEVDLLREIIDGSLIINITSLSANLNVTAKKLVPLLEKFAQTKLFQLQTDKILIDKEMRKYFESQIIKFDDDFKPDMEFLQNLLSKVPIHALPSWYALSRAPDNIFNSIVEKYLLTPKVYERYLQDLVIDDPVLRELINFFLKLPDHKIKAQTMMEKFKLQKEQFEEYMLHFEFNFVGCLSYQRENGIWEEVITPFYEWHEYLNRQTNAVPKTIAQVDEIQRFHCEDFGFIIDLNNYIKSSHGDSLNIKNYPVKADTSIFQEKTQKLNLTGEKITTWLKKPLQEQASEIYRLHTRSYHELPQPFTERDVREIEKSLKKVIRKGWIYFEDYLESLIIPLSNTEQITLKNKGKRWNYSLPIYQEEHKNLIKSVIVDRLYQAGIVALGTHNQKLCFSVTPFGRMTIE